MNYRDSPPEPTPKGALVRVSLWPAQLQAAAILVVCAAVLALFFGSRQFMRCERLASGVGVCTRVVVTPLGAGELDRVDLSDVTDVTLRREMRLVESNNAPSRYEPVQWVVFHHGKKEERFSCDGPQPIDELRQFALGSGTSFSSACSADTRAFVPWLTRAAALVAFVLLLCGVTIVRVRIGARGLVAWAFDPHAFVGALEERRLPRVLSLQRVPLSSIEKLVVTRSKDRLRLHVRTRSGGNVPIGPSLRGDEWTRTRLEERLAQWS